MDNLEYEEKYRYALQLIRDEKYFEAKKILAALFLNCEVPSEELYLSLTKVCGLLGETKEAEAYLLHLEDNPDTYTYSKIGDAFFDGEYVAQSYPKAIFYYQKGAKQGDFNSLSKLIEIYSEGIGVEKNQELAESYREDLEHMLEEREYRR